MIEMSVITLVGVAIGVMYADWTFDTAAQAVGYCAAMTILFGYVRHRLDRRSIESARRK
jgi:O-antigen/teichoic acid export membrane protein